MSEKKPDPTPAGTKTPDTPPSPVATALPAAPASNLWSKELLLAKAQRYAEQMLEHDRDDWRFGFWSTLTLELLLRASVANVSPALLADGNRDWNHLYYALGHSPKTAKFVPKSIDVTEAVRRITEILPALETRLSGFCTVHLARRNEEVHSGGTPFDGVATSTWLPTFYETCEILMQSMKLTLAELFGTPEAEAAAHMIAAAKDDSAKAVAKEVKSHREEWEKITPESREKLVAQANMWAIKQVGHRVGCPACNCTALVMGTPFAPPAVRLEQETIVEVQQFLPAKFECIACTLKISGLPKLHACGLADVYKSTSVYDPAEYYSARESFMEFEPDNND